MTADEQESETLRLLREIRAEQETALKTLTTIAIAVSELQIGLTNLTADLKQVKERVAAGQAGA